MMDKKLNEVLNPEVIKLLNWITSENYKDKSKEKIAESDALNILLCHALEDLITQAEQELPDGMFRSLMKKKISCDQSVLEDMKSKFDKLVESIVPDIM